MSARVYLADLRHNFTGVMSNDCMPLGVGFMKAVMDRDLPEVESRIFAYPDRLWDAMRHEPPDVLMLSNYMWNEWLSFHFAALMKRVRPETLVVMGGPNIPIEEERQDAYFREHPEIDVYVLGEGDFLASDVTRAFLEAGSLDRLRESSLPSCLYRDPDGGIARGEAWERRKAVDDIPSPWLTGTLDEFFDGKLAPLLETNRGCPFTCTFCVQGTRWYTKVHYFDKERIRQEIDYIGGRIRDVSPSMGFLRIADPNYGMFERDIEISSWIGEAQRDYGWPTFIDATTGKNRPERVIESLEKANGALVLYQAVQSLDERTLKNIKRSNISKDAYEQIMIHVRGRGLRSLSDLILGLPGETLESHLRSVGELIDSGTNELHLFQAMMLKGSELEMAESRAEHEMDTRFRVLPKNFGLYGDEKVFDVDEIVVATDTLSFDEYIRCRKYALASSVFWNNSWFDDLVNLVQSFGLKPSEWLAAIADGLDQAEGVVSDLVAEFEAETRGELFPSREALVAFYSQEDNFQQLCEGEIGDNLMYKYRARASFFAWPEVCATAMDTTRRLLLERGAADAIPEFDELWQDLHSYLEHKHAHGTTPDTILAPVHTSLRYDVSAWLEAGMPHDTARFRFAKPQRFVFELPPESAREIQGLFDVWTTSLKGLTKGVTRIRTGAQIRACRPQKSDASRAEVA